MDSRIIVGQFGDTNLNTAFEDKAKVRFERLAHWVEQHVAFLHRATKQEDGLGTAW